MKTHLTYPPLICTIVKKITEKKGEAFLVGGAVRNHILELPIKDLDIEVHGITSEQLQKILQEYGPVTTTGKSFGVLRLHGLDADWSLPRTDNSGRKPLVIIDPFMSIEKASLRRDLTMNALSINIQTNELIDPFNGLNDIKNKILRAPNIDLFIQDPLRFFRVMHFISRFEMTPDKKLHDACKTIDLSTISRERIEEEFRKLLLLSQRPSLGIRWLKDNGRLAEILPELAATVGIPQNPQWHPEGDVFEHSMQALDAAAVIAHSYDSNFKKLILLYAALCHDLGKVTKTTEVNGVIKSIGHEQDSNRFTLTMMPRITQNRELINAIASLTLYHMIPLQFVKSNAKTPAYKRLANKLISTVSISLLADLSLADKQGRNGHENRPLKEIHPDIITFIERAKKAGVFYKPEIPLVSGADLLTIVKPGPRMGQILKQLYELQINQGITDKEILMTKFFGK